MNIYETRRQNLINIIGDVRRHGAVAEFAKSNDLDPTYIRQIIGRNRTMGEKSARKFEAILSLSVGSLDKPKYEINEKSNTYVNISPEAQAVANAFDQASPEMQAGLLRMLGILQQSDRNSK